MGPSGRAEPSLLPCKVSSSGALSVPSPSVQADSAHARCQNPSCLHSWQIPLQGWEQGWGQCHPLGVQVGVSQWDHRDTEGGVGALQPQLVSHFPRVFCLAGFWFFSQCFCSPSISGCKPNSATLGEQPRGSSTKLPLKFSPPRASETPLEHPWLALPFPSQGSHA